MDEKISLEAVALYGNAYTEKVLKSFFSTKDQITGKEIVSLCNVHQVNLFVLRELFRAWKEETRKQKSTYFDNEHPEVKEALENYMSVLSNYILIDENNFKPLLTKAVNQTLLLICDPYDFFSALITGKNNVLDVSAFREEIKYLKINKAPLERMLQKLEDKGLLEISGNEAFSVLDQILEEVHFTPEDVDVYINQFSEVIPLNLEKFYAPKETVKPSVPPRAVNQPRAAAANQPIKSTVNDHLVSAQQPAVMDNLRKIAKIRDNLTINQKFMFTKVLFYGDFDSFTRAIEDIDQQSDINSAMDYLEPFAVNWDRESKEFHEFMELVEKRFA
jgi:hypothetical protein